MGNLLEKIINLFRTDEVYRMRQTDAEKTLANVFANAGREPSSHSLSELTGRNRIHRRGRRNNRLRLVLVLTAVIIAVILLLFFLLPGGPGKKKEESPAETARAMMIEGEGTRDNTPKCLIPTALGEILYGNGLATVDASNSSEGYIIVSYHGDCPKVKLQITGPDSVTYTFNCKGNGEEEVFPLSAGDGDYQVTVYENISASEYAAACSAAMTVVMNDKNRPYLYPNQYVNFDRDSAAVAKGMELAAPCSDDLEVVSNVYNFLVSHVTYDVEQAENVQSGYIPDVDDVLARGTGICLDYAALMAAMLRSQRIPTRLQVGYAGRAYHAWISTYIEDVGWINGIVEFDGTDWQMMDPTFAANSSESELKSFIGSGDLYDLKYSY